MSEFGRRYGIQSLGFIKHNCIYAKLYKINKIIKGIFHPAYLFLSLNFIMGPSMAGAEIYRQYTISTPEAVTAVAWSSDGKKIAGSFDYGRAFLVSTVDGKTISRFERKTDGPILGRALGFSRDGEKLIVQSGKSDKIIEIYEAQSGKYIGGVSAADFQDNRDSPASEIFSISPFSQNLVAASHLGGYLFFFEGGAFSLMRTTKADPKITAVGYFSHASRLAIGTLHGDVSIIDAEAGKTERQFEPFGKSDYGNARVGAISVSPKDDMIFVGARGVSVTVPTSEAFKWGDAFETAKVINAGTGEIIKSFSGIHNNIWQADWSADGKFLAFIDSASLYVWPTSIATAPIVYKLDSRPLSISISPISNSVAVGCGNGIEIFSIR